MAARTTWDEWADDYTFDEPVASNTAATNHYARAYSSRPSEPEITQRYEPPIRRRTMKQQRRVMFTGLVGASVFVTAIAFLTGVSILIDLSALAWFSVVLFVALALYAVSQGYLSDESLKVRLPQRRQLANVEPMYGEGHLAQAERLVHPAGGVTRGCGEAVRGASRRPARHRFGKSGGSSAGGAISPLHWRRGAGGAAAS